jgi:zinc protease
MHRTAIRFVVFSYIAAVLAVAPARASDPPEGAAPAATAPDLGVPDIPFTKKVLGNGLTVIVHEDHKAPVVGVNVWYHVGSKNERPGRTGFAHLFEHLMFNGSEHANTDWFKSVGDFGATGVNGTTNNDRTNYFETVPTGALDRTLWLESDRMGHLVDAIDQAKLDEQRGVVQNEKRQGENRPYSTTERIAPALTFPAGHPYSWQVIGSMEDLNAASLEDVKEWFRAYYGAANAVIVLCGDVVAQDAIAKVEKYFGDIPAGPPVTRPEHWIAKRTGTQRVSVEERVPTPRVDKVWNTPEWGTADSHLLELAASVLSRGQGSRLYQRLVHKDGLATEVFAAQDDSEIAGQFWVSATAAPGVDITKVEKALDEELARFVADGPTEEELALEKMQVRASFLRRVERVGGFGGKSDLLATSEVYGGRPDAWKDRLAAMFGATPAAVQQAAARWLVDGALVVETRSIAKRSAAKDGADRASMPPVTQASDPKFPDVKRAALGNGLRLVAARRPNSPLLRVDLLVDAGFSADHGAAAGTAYLTGELLGHGTTDRTGGEVRRALEALGGDMTVSTYADTTQVTVSAPRTAFAPLMEILAEVTLRSSFPADELEVRRRAQLAAIAQERVDGRGMVQRVLPRLLYGAEHPYAMPWSGTGSAAAVEKLTRDDVAKFHKTWFRPGSATLVVAGDVTVEELLPVATSAFGAWEAGTAPAKALPQPPVAEKSHIWLLDRPGAPQSVVLAAQLVPARGGDDSPLAVLNTVLGGNFVSRLNMNLREDKHWSYGARSDVRDTRGPRALSASASVQTDKTAESLAEIAKEMRRIAGAEPPTEAEIAMAKSQMTLTLPGRWESVRAVSDSLAEMVAFGLPDDWFDGYAGRVRAVTAEQAAAAGKVVRPESLVYVVVGDRKKVEAGLRALGLAEVTVVDADGRTVE